MEFRDFGHTATIPICNWIFLNLFLWMENSKSFPTSHYMQDLDLYCMTYGDQRNSFHLRAVRATQKTSSNIF
jgi:hypothetical protein